MIKCGLKNHSKPESDYSRKKNGDLYKTCDSCRLYMKEFRQSKKCSHGKHKRYCKDCGGVSICSHGKQKQCCKECDGSSICSHEKYKQYCKECSPSSFCSHGKQKRTCKDCNNPVKLTYRNILQSSKQKDISRGFFDPDHFIDTPFLEFNYDEQNGKCFYCSKSLEFNPEDRRKLLSIERKDNSIGHIKSNCVLACFGCNIQRNDRHTHDEFKKKMSLL